jgi:hypothetical protein
MKALSSTRAGMKRVENLREQPMSLAAAARTAIADGRGTIRLIAQPGRRAGGELSGLEDDAGMGEAEELFLGTTLLQARLEELFQLVRRGWSQRLG